MYLFRKLMIDGTIAACLVLALPASAQSSKFAATYDTDPVMAAVSVNGGSESCMLVEEIMECAATDGPYTEIEVASIHVAQWKEILGTMSAQINLMTFTQAKGKNGAGTVTSSAEGVARGGMRVVKEGDPVDCAAAYGLHDRAENPINVFAAPGPVTFASRRQTLTVDVDLDVVGLIPEVCNAECIEDNLGIDGSVTIGLELDTTAAHSFQFIAADLTQGTYQVVACYDYKALASVGGADIDEDTQAMSRVVIGPRIITAQEVRATKNDNEERHH